MRADDSKLNKDIAQANKTVKSGAKKAEKATDEFGSTSEKTSKKTSSAWSKMGEAAKSVGKIAGTAFAAIGSAAVAVGTKALMGAADLDKAMGKFAASTGTADADLQGYEDTLKRIYANNYGESFEDIADAMATVKKSMGDLDDASLQTITESAFLLRDTFDYDVNESVRAATALTKNFGIDGEKAMALIAKGAQNGLDFSGELLDTISEYSVQFAKVGLDADDMFKIMEKGAETGAFNLDKVGDAVKEMSIRVIDGSKSTQEGFQALGLNADEMASKFAAGGDSAKEAFNQVISGLAGMKDPVAQNTAGVALFGTMWEDLGPDVVTQLARIQDGAYATSEQLDKMAKVKYDNLGDMMAALGRQVELLLIPVGEALIPAISELVEGLLPALTPMLESLSGVFTSLIPPLTEAVGKLLPLLTPLLEGAASVFEQIIPQLETIVGNILPILMDLFTELGEPLGVLLNELLPQLLDIIGQLLPPLLEILTEILPPLLDVLFALMEPILDFIEAIIPSLMAVLEPLIDLFKALSPILTALADVIGGVLGAAFKFIEPIIDAVTTVLGGLIDFITGIFTGNWEQAWDGIVNIFKGIFNLIPAIIEGIINGAIWLINQLIGGINKLTGAIGIPAIPLIPDIKIPRFHGGGIVDFEAGEVPALLQSGEMVLTRAQQKVLFDIANGRGAPAGQSIYVESPPIYLDGRLISQNATQHQYTDVKVRRYR